MEFFEDPFGFDVIEARARKKALEYSNDNEASPVFNDNDKKEKVKGTSPFTITLPNADLDTRVEESFRSNENISSTDKNILKV